MPTIVLDGDASWPIEFDIHPTDPTITDLSGDVVKVAVAPVGTTPDDADYTTAEWAGPLRVRARFGVGGLNPPAGQYKLYGKPYDSPDVEPQAAQGLLVILRPA